MPTCWNAAGRMRGWCGYSSLEGTLYLDRPLGSPLARLSTRWIWLRALCLDPPLGFALARFATRWILLRAVGVEWRPSRRGVMPVFAGAKARLM